MQVLVVIADRVKAVVERVLVIDPESLMMVPPVQVADIVQEAADSTVVLVEAFTMYIRTVVDAAAVVETFGVPLEIVVVLPLTIAGPELKEIVAVIAAKAGDAASITPASVTPSAPTPRVILLLFTLTTYHSALRGTTL